MQFTQLILILNAVLAIPVAVEGGLPTENIPEKREIPLFPIPHFGESLGDYAKSLFAFVCDVGANFVPESIIGTFTPRLSIDFNLDFLKVVSKTDDVPNYNTHFDRVDGIDSSRVKWYTEANNRTSEDPVLIYLHGGGYIMGLNPLSMALIQDLWKEFNTKSDRLSVLVLDYTLATEKPYPQPLVELAEVYNQLQKSCNNIIISGDSAGGHLALNLLRHIKYPVDNVSEVTTKPSGLFTLSPFVNIYPNTENGTYKTNYGKDFMSSTALSGMGHMYVPDLATRISSPLNPWKDYIDWSEVLPDYSKVYTAYGDDEVLRGDIESWIDIAQLRNSSATILSEVGGIHDDMMLRMKSSPLFQPLVDFLVRNWA